MMWSFIARDARYDSSASSSGLSRKESFIHVAVSKLPQEKAVKSAIFTQWMSTHRLVVYSEDRVVVRNSIQVRC